MNYVLKITIPASPAQVHKVADDPFVGKLLDGRFKILALLGTGGMGSVYKARDTLLERVLALKVLHKNRLPSPESQTRFMQEGKIISSLMHPHIIAFYQFGSCEDDSPYIAMEYLDGITLRSLLLKESPLEWRRAAGIAIQICGALEAAHEAKAVHRDLKPENIMLLSQPEPDFVKVVDFGLAAMMPGAKSEIQKLTKTGLLLGSVNYMSPEQCQGKKADHRADIYALGCILYEMLTGHIPFSADTPVGVIYMHANNRQQAFASFESGQQIPGAMEQLVNKAMMKDPALRYQSMGEVQKDLELLLAGAIDEMSIQPASSGNSMKWQRISLLSLVSISLFLFAAGYVKTKLAAGNMQSRVLGDSGKNANTLLRPREIIRKGLMGSSLPLQVLDEALASDSLGNSERAQLLYLRAKNSPNAESLPYFCKALAALNHSEGDSYPIRVMLDTLFSLSAMTDGMQLPEETIRLRTSLCKYFEKIDGSILNHGENIQSDPYEPFDRYTINTVRYYIASTLINCGRLKEAAKIIDQISPDEHAPVGLLAALLDLGRYKQAELLVSHCRDPKTLNSYARSFRMVNMLPEASKCIALAKRLQNAPGFDAHFTEVDLEPSEALLELDKGRKDQAAKLLLDFAETDLANTASIQKQLFRRHTPANGPRLVSLLMLCGRQNEAKSLLEKYKNKKLPSQETNDLEHLSQQFRVKSDSRENHLRMLLENSKRQGVDECSRVSLAAEAYALISGPEGRALPAKLRLDCLVTYLGCLQGLGLLQQVLLGYDDLLKEPEARETTLPSDPDDEQPNARTDQTYFQWAELSKASLLQSFGKTGEVKAIMAEIEAKQSDNSFFTELNLHRLGQAERIASTCNKPELLVEMVRACLSQAQQKLATLCLQRARALPLDETTRVLLQFEESFLELEKGNTKIAQKILSGIDVERICHMKNKTKSTTLLERLAQATALAQMDKKTDEVLILLRKAEKGAPQAKNKSSLGS